MESIWFFDFSYQPLLIMHDILSVNWTLHFNDIGTFELHTAIADKVTEVLRSHPYLVAVQGSKQAVITGWQLTEECILYGRSCNWILTRRITPAFEEVTDTVDNLTHKFISEAFADTEEMKHEGSEALQETVTLEQGRDQTTFDAVQSCLKQVDAGHIVRFEPQEHCWVYQSMAGQTLPLVLSEDNRNIYDSSYTENCLEYYCGGWFQKKSEAEEEESQSESERTYLSLDESKAGIYRWECLLEAETEVEARQELAEKKWKRQTSALLRGMKFGKDYQLGDYIQFRVEKGGFQQTELKQVIGVHLWYESAEYGEEPIFN